MKKNDKLKIFVILGTRPEIIKLSRVIPKLQAFFETTVIHTGQNYDFELNEIFYKDLEIKKPDIYLNAAGKSYAETIANVIHETDKLIVKHNPDACLILGDTNSSLAAIPAKRRKVPIFHMEAGNRSYDFRVPEEVNRRIVDHISDINLTYSKIAKRYLEREGIPSEQIIFTGSPMKEVLDFYSEKIKNSNILEKLKIKSHKYFLVSCHREENVDNEIKLNALINILSFISKKYKLPIIVSTHPRTRKKLKKIKLISNKNIKFLKPFSFSDYIYLQKNSKSVLSDSGTITEESSILNFPALNLRESHERPEGFEEGSVMMVGLNLDRIENGLEILNSQKRDNIRSLNIIDDYNVDNVSEKITRIILSYIDYINKFVWKK